MKAHITPMPTAIVSPTSLNGVHENNKRRRFCCQDSIFGRLSLTGPGRASDVSLKEFRQGRRLQELAFDLAKSFTQDCLAQPKCTVPSHVLFPQLVQIVSRYLNEEVKVHPPADLKDLFLAPYYGWLVEILLEGVRPDTSEREAPEVPRYESTRGPGSTADVDYWTSQDAVEIVRSHINYVVPDTKRWEQSAAYYIDKHNAVHSFVKNAGLGFAVPYLYNGQMHDYMPDFIIGLKGESALHLILETKGYDPLEDVKRAAAERWVSAVNAEGSYGRWAYRIAKKTTEVSGIITAASEPAR